MQLASIHSAAENARVAALAQQVSDHVWIGATDEAVEGTFEWTDGSTWDFTNWASGQPDDALTGKCTLRYLCLVYIRF